MATLNVGDKAPDFSLPTGDGSTLSLKDLRGKKVVLYFYPRDNTSGCTREACDFRDNMAAVKKQGAVVIGVSTDSPDSHRSFADKFNLSFPLVSDEEKVIVKRYGVWQRKNLYGRVFHGTVRSTFIIDEHGVISHIFPKVKVDGHVRQILKALGE